MVFSASLFGTVPGAHRAGDQVFPGNLSCAAARAHVERSRSDPVTAFPDRHGAGRRSHRDGDVLVLRKLRLAHELDDGKDEKLGWLGKMDAGSLKNKVAASIVAISSIHLLRIFMDIQSIANDKLLWYVVLHLTFVLSAFVMCCIDIITKKSH